MSEQMISMFATKITELLMVLITSHFEDFSNELLKKIKNQDIDSIDDIRNLWNSKCKDNIMNISNTSVVLKLNKDNTNSKNDTNIIKSDKTPSKEISINEDKFCQVVLNKGKNKGEKCGRKCKKNRTKGQIYLVLEVAETVLD